MMRSIFEWDIEKDKDKFIEENKERIKDPGIRKWIDYFNDMIDFQKDIIFLDDMIKRKDEIKISYDLFFGIIKEFFKRYRDNEYIEEDFSHQMEEGEISYNEYFRFLIFQLWKGDYENINLRDIF